MGQEISFGQILIDDLNPLIERWYKRWREEGPAHEDVSEVALKDLAPLQLRVIADALCDGTYRSESPHALWRNNEARLQPEHRVPQLIPVEEIVQEYWLLVSTVRDWAEEKHLAPKFAEYTYFYEAIFELIAESVRRYSAFKAEEVRRERAQYVAGIAHQMRGPISVLATGLAGLDIVRDPENEHLLASLRRNIQRLTAQVAAVMRLERYREEEVPVHPEAIYPARVIDEIVSDMRDEAAKKAVAVEIVANRRAQIEADPQLLVDALDNLIGNAVRYTDTGSIRIEMEESDEAIEFRVTDTGPGIDRERKAELFKPVHSARRGGLGLGLAVACRSVKAQGGAIGVESTPGKGSTFWFRLPRSVHARA
ncbi:MAG: histidine kinase [Myxococcaceae bacterium]|nr:histidine kinase [Myxococcaceae bacterium]